MSERQKWFTDRIGKRVYRNKTSCKCGICVSGYEKGVMVNDEMHASYLCDVEAEYSMDSDVLKYFDNIEERDIFEKTLINLNNE